MIRPQSIWLPAILLFGALVRIAAMPLAHNLGLTSDEREYLFIAANVQEKGAFIDSNGDASVRSPLFPALLALSPRVSENNLAVPLVLEFLLGVLSVYLVYRLARAMWENEAAALLAAGAAALFPGLVVYSTLLLTEIPFVVLFLLILLRMEKFQVGATPGEAVLIGFLAGLAVLMRGVFMLPFLFLVLLLVVSFGRRGWNTGGRAMLGVVPLLACLAVLTPWTIRNYDVHHALVPISTFTGMSLVYGNNPYTHGSTKFDPGFDEWYRNQRRERGVEDSTSVSEYDRMRVDEEIAVCYMQAHPWDTLKHMVQKAYVLWIYPLSHQQTNRPLKIVMMASDFILYCGAALGMGIGWHLRKRFPLVWVSIAGFTVLHMVLHAEARYRVPLVPLVCVLFGGVALVARHLNPFLRDRTASRRAALLIAGIGGVYILTAFLYVSGRL
jgi:4-amino-4-deoxy-L-arabinose transferase-like glycosyltransferase